MHGCRPLRARLQVLRKELTRARNALQKELLAGSAALGAAALLRHPLPAPAWSYEQPRIAIVGAGLAGLSCAHRLAAAGRPSTIYEANPDRAGGRCWTARGFRDGQVGEHGGEFIDTSHSRIRGLVRELGLELEDDHRPTDYQGKLSSRFFFVGNTLTEAEAYAGYGRLTAKAARDAKRIGPYLNQVSGRAAREIDEMNCREWLEEAAPGPSNRVLRQAASQGLASFLGLDPVDLGGLNAVATFGPRGNGSDERFHVRGGNDLIVSGLIDLLPEGTVRRNAELTSVDRRSGGFSLRVGEERVSADVLVLCLPFTTLRRVDLSGSGLSRNKRRLIDELGMGTNSKVIVQLNRRPGRIDRWDGEYYDPFIDTWDSSIAQPGKAAVMTVYTGGRAGTSFPPGPAHQQAPERSVERAVGRIDRTVKGLPGAIGELAYQDVWARDPYVHGSYAAFLPGQYVRWWGTVGGSDAGIHFGGEQTSTAAQGYLEGAVESGERCAREVLRKL